LTFSEISQHTYYDGKLIKRATLQNLELFNATLFQGIEYIFLRGKDSSDKFHPSNANISAGV
jgi:hypothetical protein